jgi:hypothetical protein
MPFNKDVKLVYGKPEVDEETGEPVRDPETGKLHYILYGTKEKVPGESDEPLVYEDDSQATVTVSDYSYFYNKNGGVYAGTSKRQIPNEVTTDTAVNSFLSDGTPVIVTNEFGYDVALSASNGSINDGTETVETVKVTLGGTKELTLVPNTGFISPTEADVDPTDAAVVTISGDLLTISDVKENATVTVEFDEE